MISASLSTTALEMLENVPMLTWEAAGLIVSLSNSDKHCCR